MLGYSIHRQWLFLAICIFTSKKSFTISSILNEKSYLQKKKKSGKKGTPVWEFLIELSYASGEMILHGIPILHSLS